MAKKCIGIDIGGGMIKIYEQGRGVTVKEPSVAAVSVNEKEGYICCGSQAYTVFKKRPGAVNLIRPIQNGAVADFDIVLKMLTEMFEGLSFKSFDAVAAVHAGLDDGQKSVIADLVRAAGADYVALVDASVAAVVGAEFDVSDKNCVVVCDIGSGCTEISVVGGIVNKYSKLIEYGGDSLDGAVVTEIEREFAVRVSADTAKDLRENHCMPTDEDTEPEQIKVKGLNIITGLPMEAYIEPDLVYDAVYEISDYIAQSVKYVIDGVGEDIASQIRQRGILLCGGGSLTAGIAELIVDACGAAVIPAKKPKSCIVEGTGVMIENMNVFEAMLEFK